LTEVLKSGLIFLPLFSNFKGLIRLKLPIDLSLAEIAALIQPFANAKVTFEDLICLRSQITELYIDNGYINSGAFLPNKLFY
jgi:hemolysin activation/secretion protein